MDFLAPGLAAAIGVPVVFYLLSKVSPYRPPESVSAEKLAALKVRAQRIDLFCLPFIFAIAAGLTWLLAWGLYHFSLWRLGLFPTYRYLLTPEPLFLVWMLPALFLGIVVTGLVLMPILRLILGEQGHTEYLVGSQSRFQINNRVFMALAAAVVLVALVSIVFAQDWYIRFEENRIAVNPLFGYGETVYSYDDVDRLIETSHFRAPNGDIVQRECWKIAFRDGNSWNSIDQMIAGEREELQAEVRSYLEDRTRKQFRRLKLLEDAED